MMKLGKNTSTKISIVMRREDLYADSPFAPDVYDAMATFYGDSHVRKENARRALALFRMAHDLNLSTEAIEGGIVQEMVSALKSCAVEIDTLYDIYMPEMRPKTSMGQHIGTILSKIERQG